MASSSPRHAAPDQHQHLDWMEQHPSALERFEAALAAAEGKQIVVFLDYDGTLSPIVDDPDTAVMTQEMCPTHTNFMKLVELFYAGSHGMDIRGPSPTDHKAKEVLYQPAGLEEFLPLIQEVHEKLRAKMKSIPGAMVEDNKFCLSVHFRRVEEAEWDALGREVRAVVDQYSTLLRVTKGHKVHEVRPSIKWDKGSAVEFLIESLGYAGRADVFPIYIGDDRTDEDAFKMPCNMGQGLGVVVTKVPKDTRASYSIAARPR